MSSAAEAPATGASEPAPADLSASTASPPCVSFKQAVKVWARIGFLSFGGPAGQIAMMHQELVENRKWISEGRFLHALNYCMLLPGPEAQQLATYIGWLMHKTRGGLVAGTLFILPGFFTVLGLSALYAAYHQLPLVNAVFFGLKAAVLAVVVEAVIRIGKRSLKNRVMVWLAVLAFVAIFFFQAPFPLIILTAGIIGLVGHRIAPRAFPWLQQDKTEQATSLIDGMMARGVLEHTRPSRARAARVLVTCVGLWLMPLLVLSAAFGSSSVFVQEGVFFSKTAVVTFGGAYAVLAYVAQRAVEDYGWLHSGEMLDGLGMAETTPGPLILVLQFVGFMGAFRNPGELPPMAAGVLGSVITVWVTFVPCFLWILLGAPYIEALRGSRSLHAAMSAITASVVGVVFNLSVWFALHTVFGSVRELQLWQARLFAPVWTSTSIPTILIAAGAFAALLRFKIGLVKTLGAAAAAGAVVHFAGWS